MDTASIERAVERRRAWLSTQLTTSAESLALGITGPTVMPYDLRSAGAQVVDDAGLSRWLRVVVEDPDYQPACRWEGNVEANAIVGVPKPTVVRWTDREVSGRELPGHRLRTELMTLAPAGTVSEDTVLFEEPNLPDRWWTDLGDALATLATHPSPVEDPVDSLRYLVNHVRGWFDVDLDQQGLPEISWATAHADLHWANLTRPPLCILDWESWRRAPMGYDFATLYCNSLLVPDTASRLRRMAAQIFDTPSGAVSLLLAACRYLALTGEGPYAELREPLLSLGEEQLKRLAQQAR